MRFLPKDKNNRLLIVLIAVVVGMAGLGYSFVPLYRLFCQTFGIPVPSVMVGQAGEPKYLGAAPSDRTVTVRFIGNQTASVPVTLKPLDRKLTVRLGEPTLTAYLGNNTTRQSLDGVAVHTIVEHGTARPVNIQQYVDLQQCFCFEEQHYPANTEVNLPLSFAISPDLPEGVHTITFAYTLFENMEYQKQFN